MKVQVVRRGSEGEEILENAGSIFITSSFPPGTVLKLTCSQGHELSTHKQCTRCKWGEWHPQPKPRCDPVGCRLSESGEGGIFVRDLDRSILPGEGEIEHGASVSIRCDQGYFVSGP